MKSDITKQITDFDIATVEALHDLLLDAHGYSAEHKTLKNARILTTKLYSINTAPKNTDIKKNNRTLIKEINKLKIHIKELEANLKHERLCNIKPDSMTVFQRLDEIMQAQGLWMHGKARNREIVDSRKMFTLACLNLIPSYKGLKSDIARYVDKDHATILHYEKKAPGLLETETALRNTYQSILVKYINYHERNRRVNYNFTIR